MTKSGAMVSGGQASGFKVKDQAHPYGDIEITYTGLRSSKELYEEQFVAGYQDGTEIDNTKQSIQTSINQTKEVC